MSEVYTLRQYDIIDCGGILYRILGIADRIITIQMGITSRVFRIFETGTEFNANLLNGTYKIIENEKPKVIPKLSSVCQAAYDLNRRIIDDIRDVYGRDFFIGLSNRKLKASVRALKEKYLVSKHKINRLITRWLQSGCDNYALLDHRSEGTRKANGPYHYTSRPGRKNKTEEETSTVILTDELRAFFDEIIIRNTMTIKPISKYSTARYYIRHFTEVSLIRPQT